MPADDVPIRVRERVVAVQRRQPRIRNPVVEVAPRKPTSQTLYDPIL